MYRSLSIVFTCLVLIFSSNIALGVENFSFPAPPEAPEPFAAKLQRQQSPGRKSVIDPAIVIKGMDLKPGMTVLDIGAGVGYFTFPFAQALGGQGSVYATDIDPEMVDHLRGEAQRLGHSNVVPVLVTAAGVDPFYLVHSFDVIFLSNVYYHLVDRESYFRELRPSLDKKGRLFLAEPVPYGPLDTDMFGDFKSTFTRLLEEGESSPFYQRLSEDTRRLFAQGSTSGNLFTPDLQEHIVTDFNRMLTDRTLYPDFLAYDRVRSDAGPSDILTKMLPMEYFQLTKWLISLLEERNVFDPRGGKLAQADKDHLWALNRTLLITYFQLYDKTAWFFLSKKAAIVSTLEAGGYALV